MTLLLILALFQSDVAQEYREKAAKLKESDANGHYRLGLWCAKNGLKKEAELEYRKTISARPTHSNARKKLGHRKIDRVWVSKEAYEAVQKGIEFPSDEETRRMRARGPYYAKVIDIFWNRDHWAVALARIEERTGLFDGTLQIRVRFGSLGGVPAMGGGVGGKGTITLDMKNLAAYEKTIDEFLKRAARGGRVAIPPAKTPAIITHELTHCFQGVGQPSWFLEGMASYTAGDGHFVYFFRYRRIKVKAVDASIEHKYVYARGWGFFEYLEAKHGKKKVMNFIRISIVEKKRAALAAAEATGLTWDVLKGKERTWTRRWITRYRKK